MIRVLMFQNKKFGDIKPMLDGPEFMTTMLGDEVEFHDPHMFMLGKWVLVEILTSNLKD